MSNLLLAGCSHTTGFSLKENEKNWGQLFAEEYNYEVTNVALAGSSLIYSINKIIEELTVKNFDLIILQLTDLERISVGVNGKENFIKGRIQDEKEVIEHITVARYLEAVEEKEHGLKFLYENVRISNFYLNNLINNLVILQKYCILNNIKLVLLPYDHNNWEENRKPSIWNLKNSSNIDKKFYIREPFLKWLKTNYNYDDYFLDKGFHLNQKGQKLFTYEYLIPNLKNLKIIK